MSPYFVNFAYVLTLCAFVTRDVLLLRGLLVCSQIIIVTYTLSIGVHVIAGWNGLFACINTAWVFLILRERRDVRLSEELQRLHDRHFSALTASEFLRWWKQGHREVLTDVVMARTGERPHSLYFLLRGTVRVDRDGVHVTDLPAGFFVAEMSVLTGELPTTDARAVGEVEVMRWPAGTLQRIIERNPKYWTKIQSVLGRDVVEKIKRSVHPPVLA